MKKILAWCPILLLLASCSPTPVPWGTSKTQAEQIVGTWEARARIEFPMPDLFRDFTEVVSKLEFSANGSVQHEFGYARRGDSPSRMFASYTQKNGKYRFVDTGKIAIQWGDEKEEDVQPVTVTGHILKFGKAEYQWK
jgi:hypothetical protein